MSWLSNLTGIHLGNIGAPIGAALGSVIPGVGTSIGAALGQGLGAIGSGSKPLSAIAQGAGVYGLSRLATPSANGNGSQPTGDPGYNVNDPNQNIFAQGGSAPGSTGGDWQSVLARALGGGNGAPANGQPQGSGGILSTLGGILSSPGVIPAAGAVVGGALQGQAAAAINKQNVDLSREQFDRTQGLTEGQTATALQNHQDTAPLRDRAMAMLQNRLGAPVAAFKPHDIFNGGGPQNQGGVNQAGLNAANAQYQPGQGGVNTAVAQQLLDKLGYGPAAKSQQVGGPPPLNRRPAPAGALA